MVFEIKEGDTSPPLRVQLLDAQGKAVTIAGATVTFRMRPAAPGLRADIDAAATVVDEDTATVEFQWREADGDPAVGDTDVPGLYRADFHVRWGGGGPAESFPNDEDISVIVNPKP